MSAQSRLLDKGFLAIDPLARMWFGGRMRFHVSHDISHLSEPLVACQLGTAEAGRRIHEQNDLAARR